MGWWVIGTAIGAVAFAALALGFCAYELSWKYRRLRTELHRLAGLTQTLTALRADVESARHRLTDAAALAER